MHLTVQQSFAMFSTLGAGWMMVRAGRSKRVLKARVSHCAACGRRRGIGPCPCTARR